MIRTPPPRPASRNVLHEAQQRALMADIRRREALLKKGEAAKEAQRKREEYTIKRADADQEFKANAKAAMDSRHVPDEDTVRQNLSKLAKRCKTARRRKHRELVKPETKDDEVTEGTSACGDAAATGEITIFVPDN